MEEIKNPKYLNNSGLVIGLKTLVRSERKITAEILLYIREVDRRQLYLEYSYTSLFSFLTVEIGYTKASAQRRIDSARLLNELPEMKKDLELGTLNLSQVSMVAQCIRQKIKDEKSLEIQIKTDNKTILIHRWQILWLSWQKLMWREKTHC